MRSIQTKWTKTGVTTQDVKAKVSGPSAIKDSLVVPAGTPVRFIGHWVVAELGWLAKQQGEALKATFSDSYQANQDTFAIGRNTITYHDADHYGIEIDEADVKHVKDVA